MVTDTNHYGDDNGSADRAAARDSLGKQIVQIVRDRKKQRYQVFGREELPPYYTEKLQQVLYRYVILDFSKLSDLEMPSMVAFGNDFEGMQNFADVLNEKGVAEVDL